MTLKIKLLLFTIFSFVYLLFMPLAVYAADVTSFNANPVGSCISTCSVNFDWATDASSTNLLIYFSPTTTSLPLTGGSIPAAGGPYGANVSPTDPKTIVFPTNTTTLPITYNVWISFDGTNQNGTLYPNYPNWFKTVTVNPPASPIPTPAPTPTPAASSSPSSNNNNSTNNNSSPTPSTASAPAPQPAPIIKPTLRPTPTPKDLFPSPDASSSAVLGTEIETNNLQTLGTETNNEESGLKNINPLFIILPIIALGLGLLVWVLKDSIISTYTQHIASQKQARLEKMITSQQKVSEEPI